MMHRHSSGFLTNSFRSKRLCSDLKAEMEIGVVDWDARIMWYLGEEKPYELPQ